MWSHDFPTEPGYYWCYGWLYNDWDVSTPELTLVIVRQIGSSTYTVANGQFLYNHPNKQRVVFTPAALPTLPTIGDFVRD